MGICPWNLAIPGFSFPALNFPAGAGKIYVFIVTSACALLFISAPYMRKHGPTMKVQTHKFKKR